MMYYTLLYLLYFIALPCFSYVMMYQDSAIVMQKYNVSVVFWKLSYMRDGGGGYAPTSNHWTITKNQTDYIFKY